jgi:hypothetical protein
MESNEKLEERKRNNAPFLTAFEHVRKLLSLTKGEMCKLLNVKASRLSEWDKGEKPVPETVKCALVDLSAHRNIGQISMDYLDGYTGIMLLANIPDDELAEIKMRRSNPDYDQLKARRESKWKEIEEMMNVPSGQPTPSSVFNASLAQQAENVEAFRIALESKDETIKEKNERIIELKDAIKQRDERIENLKELVAQLRSELIEAKAVIEAAESGLAKYPFKMGAADEDNKQTRKRV